VTAAAPSSSTTPSPPVPEAFTREYGCTQDEWLRWMPEAVHGHRCTQPQEGRLHVSIGQGLLVLDWHVLTPRVIALIRLPRMTVNFSFSGVTDDKRTAFLKRFDLHLQRGGG